METKKPIKRDPAIVEFSRDHHFGLLLVWKIRQGSRNNIEPERISQYVLHIFKKEIIPHFDEEEKLLFPKLPDNDQLRIQAENDHRNMKKIINKLKMNPGEMELLENFADRLEKHIRFEERQLFNHLQDNLTAESLNEIAALVKPGIHEPDSAWDDVFWEIKKS